MSSRYPIETARLKIYKPEDSDYEKLCLLLLNPLMSMYKESQYTPEEIQTLMIESQSAIENGYVGLRTIYHKESEELIGFGGVKISMLGNHQIYECYMYIHQNYWDKGYGKEALSATINQAFNTKDINVVHCFIGLENYSMQYLLESLGFFKVGWWDGQSQL